MQKLFVLLASLTFLLAACSRSGPKPLSVAEIPPAIRKAFQPARLLPKQNAESIAKLVEDQKFALASIQLQALLPQELTPQQRDVVSAALETVNRTLAAQAANAPAGQSAPGGPAAKAAAPPSEDAAAAAAVVDHYIRTK